jgi:hypothetical protein
MPEEGVLPSLAFRGRWRRYQELALEAFERDRRAGRRSTHLLAPPGSGKTVLGMEIRKLSTSVRQVDQGFVVPGVSSSGLLIHAAVGSWGGVGGLRTNRSGWAA